MTGAGPGSGSPHAPAPHLALELLANDEARVALGSKQHPEELPWPVAGQGWSRAFPRPELQLGRPLPRLLPQGCPQALCAASLHFFFFSSLWFFFLFLKLLCRFPFRNRMIIFG